MIEKLDVINSGINVIDRFGFTQNVPVARIYCNKINEIIDIINAIIIDVDGTKCVDGSKAPADNSGKANCQENVQDDHYWYKQQERYKAALVLIRNLSGAGMSYHDMCIESREIAKWALDPDYKPLLIGRYSKDDQELFDTLNQRW